MPELQADCFSGLWAHQAQRARQILEEGDIEEALNAASAVGDDGLQHRAGDMSHRIHLPTAAPGNVYAGLSGAFRQAMSPNVIPSGLIIFEK
ncbi:MAG: neutral zinc metallopeptidase [Desulfobacterales bacterium]|jgi:hypothetical protein